MEFLKGIERPIKKKPQKELPKKELQGELCPFPNPAKETAEEKNLKSIGIIESTKKRLSDMVFYFDTEDGKGGVFKGEKSWHTGKRERAAYIVDKFLGFDLVPATVMRTTTVIRVVGEEGGSFQRFVSDANTGLEVSKDSVQKEDLVKLALFDFLINSQERHKRNFLIKKGHIIAIDNENSFSAKYTFPRPEYFGGENFSSISIPKEIKNKILQFDKWPESKNLTKSLQELLEKEEVEVFGKRLELLIQYAQRGYFQTEEEYKKYKEDKQFNER